VWIHQNAWFQLGRFENASSANYSLHDKNNGVYAFVLKGSLQIGDTVLHHRDGLGIWDTDNITIQATADDTEVLLMEVPMMF
jgi:quercetin 2,3-dioxygenase